MDKILIIRFSSIGDILVTTPVIRCLRNKYPNAQIDYLTKQQYAGLLKHNPYLNNIIAFQQKQEASLARQLKKEHYNLVVDLHKNLRTHIFRILMGFPKWLTYNKLNVKKWLFVNFKINLLPKKHLADRYFESLAKIDVKYDGQGLDFTFPEKKPQLAIPSGSLAIVIGAKYATKAIPANNIAEAAIAWQKPIVLIGGKAEIEKARTIEKALSKNNVQLYNYVGKTTFEESAYLLEQAEKVMTGDTGMMHLASALKKPMLMVWGSTHPAFGMYPFYPKNEQNKIKNFAVNGLKCCPCSKIGHKKCPKKHFKCMINNKITINRKN